LFFCSLLITQRSVYPLPLAPQLLVAFGWAAAEYSAFWIGVRQRRAPWYTTAVHCESTTTAFEER